MKVTKLVPNPLHVGRLYLVDEVTFLEEVSEADLKRLLEYEKAEQVKVDREPVARQRIKEAAGEPVEEVKPKRAPKSKE